MRRKLRWINFCSIIVCAIRLVSPGCSVLFSRASSIARLYVFSWFLNPRFCWAAVYCRGECQGRGAARSILNIATPTAPFGNLCILEVTSPFFHPRCLPLKFLTLRTVWHRTSPWHSFHWFDWLWTGLAVYRSASWTFSKCGKGSRFHLSFTFLGRGRKLLGCLTILNGVCPGTCVFLTWLLCKCS